MDLWSCAFHWDFCQAKYIDVINVNNTLKFTMHPYTPQTLQTCASWLLVVVVVEPTKYYIVRLKGSRFSQWPIL